MKPASPRLVSVLSRTSNFGSETLNATLRPEEDPLGATNIFTFKILDLGVPACASLRVWGMRVGRVCWLRTVPRGQPQQAGMLERLWWAE